MTGKAACNEMYATWFNCLIGNEL